MRKWHLKKKCPKNPKGKVLTRKIHPFSPKKRCGVSYFLGAFAESFSRSRGLVLMSCLSFAISVSSLFCPRGNAGSAAGVCWEVQILFFFY